MRKIYLLDTSVLVSDPHCFDSFKESDIILHITVLDELDKLKKLNNEAGKNARIVIRIIDEISDKGDINIGVLLNNNSILKIDSTNYSELGNSLYGDTRILACAKAIKDGDVILVSNDINMRVRAKSMGLMAQGYDKQNTNLDELYSGVLSTQDEDIGALLLEKGSLDKSDHNLDLFPNQCVVFKDEAGAEIVKARHFNNGKIKPIKKHYPWALTARNTEQELLLDLLMDKNIPLVSCIGQAGCGKTLCALAAALELVINKRAYDRLVIYRPIQPVGNDIGFLPGELNEKLFYWFSAIYDNLEVLLTPNDEKSGKNKDWRVALEMLQKNNRIQMEALTYIRGRSIPNSIILVDEAQNISPEDMKTILSRAGENSKFIITGDLSQIDSKNLDTLHNGLAYTVEKFKSSKLAAHITLRIGERSPLATETIKLM